MLMAAEAFAAFRLVGGTALSLYRGHRMSIDIDLFTDAEYDSVDFEAIDTYCEIVSTMLTPMTLVLSEWANHTLLGTVPMRVLSWIFIILMLLLTKLP